MASISQAALLDQLMGIDRNSARKSEMKWDDERICKYYLAGFCPHELFVNTRMSLGTCAKIHDTNLLARYKSSSLFLKVGYERKLQRFLQSFVHDIENKIKYNEEKLQAGYRSNALQGIQSRLREQEEEINRLVAEIETLGNEGKIGECQYLHTQLEEKQKQFKYDKIELERQKVDSLENQDVVCKICGAYTSKNDMKNSVENHISGKIHSGYVKINEVLDELANVLNERPDSQKDDEKDRSLSKHKKDDRDSERHHSRKRSRDISEHRRRDRSNHRKDERHPRKHRDERERNHRKEKRRSRSRNERKSPSDIKGHRSKDKSKKRSSKRESDTH